MKATALFSGLAAALLGASSALAVNFPFFDGFEAYTNGTLMATVGTNGWSASGVSVVVVNTGSVVSGTNALWMGMMTTLTNTISEPAITKVWTDVHVKPVTGVLDEALEPGVSTAVAFWTNGFLAVRSGAAWDVCSNDVRGGVASNGVDGSWARVTILQDYGNSNAAIFLDGQLLRQEVPLLWVGTHFDRYTCTSGGGSSGVDNVMFTNRAPVDIADAAEVDQYGYVAMIRRVGAGQAYSTLSNALAAARSRDTIIVMPGTSLSEGSLALSSNLTVLVSNAVLTCSGLALGSNSVVTIVNGTATVNGVSYAGTLAMVPGWDNAAPTPSPIPFGDGFETYPAATYVKFLGASGWSASDTTNAVVQTSAHGGNHAVMVGHLATVAQTATNRAGYAKVWTAMWVRPALGAEPADTNGDLVMYFNADGYLTLLHSGVWDVCSNDVQHASVSNLLVGAWALVAVSQDYDSRKAAVFLNGQLLRQEIGFSSACYTKAEVGLSLDLTYLDDVLVTNGVPGVMTSGVLALDGDHDGIPDAFEIDRYGSITYSPRGSVYVIR